MRFLGGLSLNSEIHGLKNRKLRRVLLGILLLACHAQAMPNLLVTELSVGSPREVGSPVTITALVKNSGLSSAGAFDVHFYVDDSFVGETTVNPSGGLWSGETSEETFSYTATSSGTHEIRVVADGAEVISEMAEFDNEKTISADWEAGSDADGDGIDDDWEAEHFPATSNCAPNVTCANGINSMLQAYIADLDPNDPESRFELTLLSTTSETVLQWVAATGRVYSVDCSTNLSTDGFQPLETGIEYPTNSLSVPNIGNAFYRINVELKSTTGGAPSGGGGAPGGGSPPGGGVNP